MMGQRTTINKHLKEKLEKLAIIEKTAKISKDRSHLVIRVPLKIQEAAGMKKGEYITFRVEKGKLKVIFRGD